MPLHTQDGQACVGYGLGTMVDGAALDHLQPCADFVQTLVMGRVDLGSPSIEKKEKTARLDEAWMVEISVGFQMQSGIRHILYDGAAESNIDELHSFADAKNRQLVPDTELQRLKLQNVQFGVYGSGAFVLLTEKGGRDIAPSGQQKPAAVADFSGIQGGDGLECVFPEKSFIVCGVLFTAQNGYFVRLRHSFFHVLTKMLYSSICRRGDYLHVKRMARRSL